MPPAINEGPNGIILLKPIFPNRAMMMANRQEKSTMTSSAGAPKVAPSTANKSTSPIPIASRGTMAEVVLPLRESKFSISYRSVSNMTK